MNDSVHSVGVWSFTLYYETWEYARYVADFQRRTGFRVIRYWRLPGNAKCPVHAMEVWRDPVG